MAGRALGRRRCAARPARRDDGTPQASQASRTPQKICRRIGRSQLRNDGRIDARRDRPRSAPQHSEVAAEERQAVALVQHRGETRPRLERGGCPLPDIADQLLDAIGRRSGRVGAYRRRPQSGAADVGQRRGQRGVAPRPSAAPARCRVPGARLLPLLLGGQSRPGPRGVGLGLEVADVLDRLVRRNFLDVTEAAPAAVRQTRTAAGSDRDRPGAPSREATTTARGRSRRRR